ncbi:MAG: hypothetical protein E6336_09170 [Lactobacillus crispatus]|nr:hypothetical protein [Lactobacillus crispatus]
MLIEAGEMAQAFRLNGLTIISDFGDISWSGFDDEKLKSSLGLKKYESRVITIFWNTR